MPASEVNPLLQTRGRTDSVLDDGIPSPLFFSHHDNSSFSEQAKNNAATGGTTFLRDADLFDLPELAG